MPEYWTQPQPHIICHLIFGVKINSKLVDLKGIISWCLSTMKSGYCWLGLKLSIAKVERKVLVAPACGVSMNLCVERSCRNTFPGWYVFVVLGDKFVQAITFLGIHHLVKQT